MKTIRTFIASATIILAALALQGCPEAKPDDTGTDIYAYVFSPSDSIYTRFYTMPDGIRKKHELTFAPRKDAFPIEWFSATKKMYGDIIYDSEYHDLHIRKGSNREPAYVLRCAHVIVNDRSIAWDRLPEAGYSMIQVIDTLLMHHPEVVEVIADMQEHNISGNQDLLKPVAIQM